MKSPSIVETLVQPEHYEASVVKTSTDCIAEDRVVEKNDTRRLVYLISIMGLVVFMSLSVGGSILYNAAFHVQKERLLEFSQNHAKVLDAVSMFDARYSGEDISGGASAATLMQFEEASRNFKGLGKTGEIMLAKAEDKRLMFLLPLRYEKHPESMSKEIFIGSPLERPMQLALSGESGTMIAKDYRNRDVLAAYSPASFPGYGVVVKIDVSEIRQPFLYAARYVFASSFIFVLIGAISFLRLVNPLLRHLQDELAKRKCAESGLKSSLQELKEKKRDLEKVLEKSVELRRVADEACRVKSNFLNNMSHELRTPLTVIMGNIKLLLDEDLLPEKEEIVEIAADINNSSARLSNLINDLLDFSKIEAGRMELTLSCFNAADITKEVISDAISRIRALDKNIGIELITEGNLEVCCDKKRFRQIMYNLVDNSVKFTQEGSIYIYMKEVNGEMIASISDTGRGIDYDNCALLFKPFSQEDCSSTRQVEGAGLGLAITKRLVELHGGKVAFCSAKNVGSTFEFSMPVKIPA